METLIVGKTRMFGGACIGGIVLDTAESVRLLPSTGREHPATTPYEVGQVWDIEFQAVPTITPPHVEDRRVASATFLRVQPNLRQFLLSKIIPWQGPPNTLFGGVLQANENGKGYLAHNGPLPPQSTGFWIPNQPLSRTSFDTDYTFHYPANHGVRSLKYVGFASPPASIPAGSLVRVSLATWWNNPDPRCYLQLSGVF